MTTYNIKHTDNRKLPIEISTGDVNTSLDVDLFGRIRLEYGEQLNQNLLNLLENFACPADTVSGELYPANPDLSQTSSEQLLNPVEGQLWYNSSNKHMYFWNSSEWVPLFLKNDKAANWGQISHGQAIPRPVSQDGYQFTYPECIWIVSPAYVPGKVDTLVCATDDSANVTMQYRFSGQGVITNGVANYLIIGIRGNNDAGVRQNPPLITPSPSPSPTPSATATPPPTPSITPTRTPPVGASPTPTPTRSSTPQPSNSPAAPSPTPSATPAESSTPGSSVTPTPTVTISPTPTNAPSPTPTPSPSPSPVPQMTVELLASQIGGGLGPFSGEISASCVTGAFDDGPLGCGFYDVQPCAFGSCSPQSVISTQELIVRVSGGIAPYTVESLNIGGTMATPECFYIAPSPINSLPTTGIFDTRIISSSGGVAGSYGIVGRCSSTPNVGSGSYTLRVRDSSPVPNVQNFTIGWSMTRSIGTGGGGGGSISVNALLPNGLNGSDIQVGDSLLVLNSSMDGYETSEVISTRKSMQRLVCLTSYSGITLTCSDNTPLTVRGGSTINSTEAAGYDLPVQDEDGFRWERIISVDDAGYGEVNTIFCDNQCYAAGDTEGRWIWTHNSNFAKL